MARTPPPGGGASGQKAPLDQSVMPQLGRMPESQGQLVPVEWIGPLLEAKVGQMKAELRTEFSGQLDKIDDLPTKWQLIATVASAIVIGLGLIFGVMAYFGDRQDNAIERSSSISGTLTRIEGKLDEQPQPEAPNAKRTH